MINRLFKSFLLVLLVSCPVVMADSVSAYVDKSEISFGETFNLTIETDIENATGPDLTILETLFDVLGNQQSSQVIIEDGKTTSSVQWVITLKPRQKTDGIVIPELSVANKKTKPITIKITDTPKVIMSVDGAEILKVETSVEKPSAYIHQQLILTLRVYAREDVIKANTLIQPTIDNATLIKLNDESYSQEINNRSYTIVERRYILTPTKSGELKVPPFMLSAVVHENNANRNKTVESNELSLKIKPKPANYPANAAWLPAKLVTLDEQWDKPLDNITQGDTLTRTLRLSIEGLASSQAGPIITTAVTGLRSYPDKPILNDKLLQNVVYGTREEHEVLVPIQVGEVTIPEIKVAWWNIETDQLEYASVIAKQIEIKPNPVFSTSGQPNSQSNIEPTIVQKIESPSLWIWQLLTAVFAAISLTFLVLWLYSRKQPAIIKELAPAINPRTLLNDIKQACQAGDPQAARQALDNWAKQQPENLIEIAIRSQVFNEAIEELNAVLYSQDSQDWQGNKLWDAIQNLPEKSEKPTAINTVLPPLYPK